MSAYAVFNYGIWPTDVDRIREVANLLRQRGEELCQLDRLLAGNIISAYLSLIEHEPKEAQKILKAIRMERCF